MHDERFSTMATSLGKKLVLPTFQLDALVLLRVNWKRSFHNFRWIAYSPCRHIREVSTVNAQFIVAVTSSHHCDNRYCLWMS